jgi:hypothetical protein
VLFVAGGVVGLVTGGGWGYFFERRAKKVAQESARELKQDVKKLSNALYDNRFQVRTGDRGAPAGRPQGALTAQIVLKRARDTQDEIGHVDPKELVAHFLALGYPMQEIDTVCQQLRESGELTPDDSLLAVR